MKNRSNALNKRNKGYALTELAASIAVFLPLTVILLYTVWQIAQYVFILNSLSEAARSAARYCAIAYGAPSAGATGTGDSQGPNAAPPQPTAVYTNPATTMIVGSGGDTLMPPASPNQAFSAVRIGDIVQSNSQFTAYYTPPAVNNQDPSLAIGRVNVVVTYTGNFPKPDLLGLSALMPKITLQRSCTYPLEY